MPNPSDPLDARERAELDAFLRTSTGGMSPARARGYLTAIASAPTFVQPSTWLGRVLGDGGLADLAHAQRVFGLVSRLYNEVIATLDAGGDVAPPASAPDEDATSWCLGYLTAADGDDRWRTDDQGTRLILPLAVVAGVLDPATATVHVPVDDRATCRARLSEHVRAIDRYWDARRPPPAAAPVRRAGPKVGRNEACPCGSGKKAKRCCGATLH